MSLEPSEAKTDAIEYFCRKYRTESNVFTISKGIVADIYELEEERLFDSGGFIAILAHYLAGLAQLQGKGKILEGLIREEVGAMQAKLLTKVLDMAMPIPVQLFKDKRGSKVLATSGNLVILCKCYGISVAYEELTDTVVVKFPNGLAKELAKTKLEDLLALNELPTTLTNRVHLVSMKYKVNPIRDYLDYPAFDGTRQVPLLGLTQLEMKFLSCFARQVLDSVETGGLLPWVFTGSIADYEQLFQIGSSAIWKQVSILELGLSRQVTTKVNRMFLPKGFEVSRRQNLVCNLTMKQILNSDYKVLPMEKIIAKLITVGDKQKLWKELLAMPLVSPTKTEIVEYLLMQRVTLLNEVLRKVRLSKDLVKISIAELATKWGVEQWTGELAFALAKKFVVGHDGMLWLPREGL